MNYLQWIVKRWLTQTARSKTFHGAVEAKFGQSRMTKRLRLQSELIVNALEEMLEEVAAREEAAA
jgi:hypothetical protein